MLGRPQGDEKGHERTLCTIVEVRRFALVEGTVGVGSAQAAICHTLVCRLDFLLSLAEASCDRDPRDWISTAPSKC